MLICPDCFEKHVVWSYMPSKYEYCEDCVPRGCSCNEEYIFKRNSGKENNFNEDIENLQNILSSKEGKYVEVYITFNKNMKNGTIDILKDSNFVLLDKSLLFNNYFIQNLEKNKDFVLKIVSVDDNHLEYPCCEYMFLDNEIHKLEVHEVLFSLKHNGFVIVSDIFDNGNFKTLPYKISIEEYKKKNDFQEDLIDNANPIYYDKIGFSFDSFELDLLVSPYEIQDKEFQVLNDLVFNTFDNGIIKYIEDYGSDNKIISNILDDNNYDFSFIFSNNEISEIIIYIQNYLSQIFVVDIGKINELIKLLSDFHRINNKIKYTEYKTDIELEDILFRKETFVRIFNILYNDLERKDENY